jgi:uncharacterized protein (DUF1800 family)
MSFRRPVAIAVLLVLWWAGQVGPAGAVSSGTPLEGDQRILHVLNRLGYGPRPGDLERVRSMGLDAYVRGQLDPQRLDDSAVEAALQPLRTLGMSTAELLREYPRPDKDLKEMLDRGEMSRRELMERYPPEKRPARIALEMQAAKLLRAVMSERQFQEIMVDFWFNHFNVDVRKGEVRWYLTSYERCWRG